MASNTMLDTGSVPIVVAEGGTGLSTATAYAVLNAGTTSTGAFQSASGVGTSGQAYISNGAAALASFMAIGASGAFSQIKLNTFTSGSGTYTPTSGMKYCLGMALGGGGAGGGTDTATGASSAAAGGGGSGSCSINFFSAATIGASKAYSIGPGGTGVSNGTGGDGTATTFGAAGALLSAPGGKGAVAKAHSTLSGFGLGGAGGAVGSGGLGGMNYPGSPGQNGFNFIGANTVSGSGANSLFAGAAIGVIPVSSAVAGNSAVANTGAGGSGSAISAVTGSNQAGGNGGSGILIIIEYI